ncbi:DUF1045 domain-containing protein [uncultured Tateyamaria sp.]|uniref:DUF1045 domain-containing protein n=1 Tax=uncultured Tateyamaria sp. TaxID=455651 RepID=UPI00262FDE05|nr:DUF1045 domain-containing protein [uncultured Tateyamaria sp.]
MYRRYAIFYTPAPDTPLARFGAEWLGWDSAMGITCAHPDAGDVDVARITETPRKYGFHGTIKAPFRLAEEYSAEALGHALRAFCAQRARVEISGLTIARLGRFLALVPVGPQPALTLMAGEVVQTLDPFRAPLTVGELAKRRQSRLSAAQDANLVRWGYPFVLEAFRFHMTLTGRLAKEDACGVEAALDALLRPLALSPYVMTGLTLLGEDDAGCFHQIERYRFGEP